MTWEGEVVTVANVTSALWTQMARPMESDSWSNREYNQQVGTPSQREYKTTAVARAVLPRRQKSGYGYYLSKPSHGLLPWLNWQSSRLVSGRLWVRVPRGAPLYTSVIQRQKPRLIRESRVAGGPNPPTSTKLAWTAGPLKLPRVGAGW